MLKDFPQPQSHLATLHNVGGRPGIEIEDHHRRASDVFRQRERRVQFDRGQIRQPHQRGQIVSENVMHGAAVSLAPDRSGLHPVGPVLWRILLVEKFFVHAVGITLAGERAPGQMRHHRRRDADVVVDDLLLGESRRRVQHLFQIRQLELLALNLNGRIHRALQQALCLKSRPQRKIQGLPPTQ